MSGPAALSNEPDLNPSAPMDPLSLHYPNPADFATLYETVRTALHAVAPGVQVVVGGVLDSGGTPAPLS